MENKKTILFTHGIDIDGYGCAVLANLAWGENVTIVYADNFDLDQKFLGVWKEKGFQDFKQIYVTDHCLSETLCEKIDNDELLKNKIKIFDHHASRIGHQDKFPWVKIISEQFGHKHCGTSLFFNHLVKNRSLEITSTLDAFVNLTRLYDTWEWTQKNAQTANMLNTLALALGRENYVELMTNKFLNKEQLLTDKDLKVIANYQTAFNKKVDEFVSQIDIINFLGFKAGYVSTKDIFKNDIANKVRNLPLGKKIEFLLMPLEDRQSVSLRSVKPEFDVSKIAVKFGGGGHCGAASFPKEKLPKTITNLNIK